jgi:hypothetical protein
MPFVPDTLKHPYCPYCIDGYVVLEKGTLIPKCAVCNKKVLLIEA